MGKDDKKSATIGGLRISECSAKEYRKALKHYGVRRADFARMCIDTLIQSYQAGREIELPVSFVLGAERTARQAVEAQGIDTARFREELAKDIIASVTRGDRIALPGHILTERELKILSGFKPSAPPIGVNQHLKNSGPAKRSPELA